MTRTFSIAVCLLILGLTATAQGRTITLMAEDCNQLAYVTSQAPRVSWAGFHHLNGIWEVTPQVQLKPGMGLFVRYGLGKIPPDQRILKAELTLHAQYVAGAPKIQVRRVLADWGLGVCHQYSKTFPQKVEWSQPGGRGASDRAPKDTALMTIKAVGDVAADVTEDIDLWYSGGAPNRGWIMTLENDAGVVYLPSPYSPHAPPIKQWLLQITYEPK